VYSITIRLGSKASRVNDPTGFRVLLVDDDESILEVISTAFEHRGYGVLEARDGSEALVRAERDAPDLVVLDLVMPRRSGFAVLDRLRQRHATPRTPRSSSSPATPTRGTSGSPTTTVPTHSSASRSTSNLCSRQRRGC